RASASAANRQRATARRSRRAALAAPRAAPTAWAARRSAADRCRRARACASRGLGDVGFDRDAQKNLFEPGVLAAELDETVAATHDGARELAGRCRRCELHAPAVAGPFGARNAR